MKKSLLIILVLILASCAAPAPKGNSVCFKTDCFEVELAASEQERAYGLMFRQHLEENKGMIFVFEEEAKHSFWMKNTMIPLDIIWIDSDNNVVYISKNTPQCKEDPCPVYGPEANSKYVLEVNAGIADKIGLAAGDVASINIEP